MQTKLIKSEICFKINSHIYKQIMAIAYFEKEDIVDVLNNVLGEGIRCYEERNGKTLS